MLNFPFIFHAPELEINQFVFSFEFSHTPITNLVEQLRSKRTVTDSEIFWMFEIPVQKGPDIGPSGVESFSKNFEE